MRRLIVLGGLLVFGALSMTAMALQQAPAPAASAIEVDKLSDNLYVLKALTAGGGGNTAVFVTADGVVVVDTKNPGWGRPLLDRIKMLTDKPVTMIINTHTHGDHVSGNVEFPATVDVIAHENTKANMTAMRPASFVAQPAGGPPTNIFTRNNGTGMAKRTFKDTMTIGSGADRIELQYFGRAHTNGDAMVLFPAARVLHMADVFATKGLPGMDANNGGTGVGYAETLTKVDAAIRRLGEGSYGDCFECGDEISEARLRALPFAVRCKDCEEARETAEQRERMVAQRRGSSALFFDMSN